MPPDDPTKLTPEELEAKRRHRLAQRATHPEGQKPGKPMHDFTKLCIAFGLVAGIPSCLILAANLPEMQRSTEVAREKADEKAAARQAEAARRDQEREERLQRLAAEATCEQILKRNLRDPDSYKRREVATSPDGSLVLLSYHARNGFGGMNVSMAQCSVNGDQVTLTSAG